MNKLFSWMKNKNKDEEIVISNICWSFDETRNSLLKSSFINIPNEIILHIFQYLSIHDLCNVSLVCRSFKMLADHDEFWKSKWNTSTKLYSKSYKHMNIEWIHQKYLRNKKLKELKQYISKTGSIIYSPSSLYPIQPIDKHKFESIIGFNQHPNVSQEMTIQLSVNIDRTAPELISLLEKTSHFQQKWKESIILKQMIKRYYQFMQLKSSLPINILLIPTLDIEIVWQTHLLRHEIYQNDCIRLFHRVIDHSLIINDIEQFFKEQAFLDTCQLYEQKFGEKYCSLPLIKEKNEVKSNSIYNKYESLYHIKPIYSYWDKTSFEFSLNSSKNYENPFSFTEDDIIRDGKSFDLCKQFMFNSIEKLPILDMFYIRPTEIDLKPRALKLLKKSYERFLYMAAKYPRKNGNVFIPPTYAIDIIWHSHMQEPLNYACDCLRIVGYVIFHDPWPIIEDENINKSFDQIDKIWKDEFQSDINIDHLKPYSF